jgi:antirestriction protein ArdC
VRVELGHDRARDLGGSYRGRPQPARMLSIDRPERRRAFAVAGALVAAFLFNAFVIVAAPSDDAAGGAGWLGVTRLTLLAVTVARAVREDVASFVVRFFAADRPGAGREEPAGAEASLTDDAEIAPESGSLRAR